MNRSNWSPNPSLSAFYLSFMYMYNVAIVRSACSPLFLKLTNFENIKQTKNTKLDSTTNGLQYIQIPDQQQYQLQQRQQYLTASQFLSSRINALNNNNASLRAASSYIDLGNTNGPYQANLNQTPQISAAIASSTSSGNSVWV